MTRSSSRARAARRRTVPGEATVPVGLSGRVTTTHRGSLPAARAA